MHIGSKDYNKYFRLLDLKKLFFISGIEQK